MDVADTPLTQLPTGRYPASRSTVRLVAILVLITFAALAFGLPGR